MSEADVTQLIGVVGLVIIAVYLLWIREEINAL